MVRVGIVGVSGYSGALLLELLLHHPRVRVTYASALNTTGKLADLWPRVAGQTELRCDIFQAKRAIELCDLILLAVPHTNSLSITPKLLKGNVRVIDLSADYRLKNKSDYKTWYNLEHSDPANLAKAVYGLPELHRADIKKSRLVANPGCYPTAAILGLAPLVSTQAEAIDSITIDAKSGVSGAGKKIAPELMFVEVNENFKAYKVLQHQHTPEIERQISKLCGYAVTVAFVPHLLPINNGILSTIYVRLKKSVSLESIYNLYKKFYKTEPFVRLHPLGHQPELKHVGGTNYCDVGLAQSSDQNLLVVTTVIDNLMKGASGQAIQNLNIMCGFKEAEGLK